MELLRRISREDRLTVVFSLHQIDIPAKPAECQLNDLWRRQASRKPLSDKALTRYNSIVFCKCHQGMPLASIRKCFFTRASCIFGCRPEPEAALRLELRATQADTPHHLRTTNGKGTSE
ncbi:MAG: hypothetical protein MUC46_09460 [Desulfobacterales bacterium]|jgi:hypothetical protein|nr:hypothetical protein [Desulfobacterales bacterium]